MSQENLHERMGSRMRCCQSGWRYKYNKHYIYIYNIDIFALLNSIYIHHHELKVHRSLISGLQLFVAIYLGP